MQVSEVMTTGVKAVKKEDNLRKVVTGMIQRHCGSVPVVDDAGTLVGIVTLRDVLLPLYPNYGEYIHDNVHSRDFEEMQEGYPKMLGMNVGEVMTANPFTISPDEPVLKAASYMGLKNLRHIPVADDGKLVGVVTISDINQALFF
ncbi:MAG: CBS domain-containing protein, partial [Mariprofundaceae bacterium]|nr:CBS domain-containing protein [Mariprofundaceae bacterium]